MISVHLNFNLANYFTYQKQKWEEDLSVTSHFLSRSGDATLRDDVVKLTCTSCIFQAVDATPTHLSSRSSRRRTCEATGREGASAGVSSGDSRSRTSRRSATDRDIQPTERKSTGASSASLLSDVSWCTGEAPLSVRRGADRQILRHKWKH